MTHITVVTRIILRVVARLCSHYVQPVCLSGLYSPVIRRAFVYETSEMLPNNSSARRHDACSANLLLRMLWTLLLGLIFEHAAADLSSGKLYISLFNVHSIDRSRIVRSLLSQVTTRTMQKNARWKQWRNGTATMITMTMMIDEKKTTKLISLLLLGGIVLVQEAISHIGLATYFSVFSVAWSVCQFVVCRLSHSCTLLKPFDGIKCHLIRANGAPDPQDRTPQLKRIIAGRCCHQGNKNDELHGLATVISPLTKLLWTCFHHHHHHHHHRCCRCRRIMLYRSTSIATWLNENCCQISWYCSLY